MLLIILESHPWHFINCGHEMGDSFLILSIGFADDSRLCRYIVVISYDIGGFKSIPSKFLQMPHVIKFFIFDVKIIGLLIMFECYDISFLEICCCFSFESFMSD